MKKLIYLSGIMLIAGSLFMISCSDDEEDKPGNPTMSLLVEDGYISANTTAKYDDTLRFMVYNFSNGTDLLSNFTATVNGDQLVDSTFEKTSFSIEIIAQKTVLDEEVWKFETTDKAGHIVSFSVTVTGDFGPIITHTDILLGAQDNPTTESFLSYSNGTFTKYFQAQAFEHQADIDMFCFYEDTPEHQNFMSLAAPGTNISGIFTGTTAPEYYTTKDTTYFVATNLTVLDFESITNDARIIEAYDFENDYRKASKLDPGDILAFRLQSGRYGLLNVTAVEGTEDGTLKFDVKIQE
jgi:hypothetical protein